MRSDANQTAQMYTPEQRAEMLRKMSAVASRFYGQAVMTGVHAFIEFNGLMNEFIKVCQRANEKGVDFAAANTHSSISLPFEDYNVAYLAEKLNCIYGPELLGNDELRRVFISELFGGQYKLVPTKPNDGWQVLTAEDPRRKNARCDECGEEPKFFHLDTRGINYRCPTHMDLEHLARLALEAFALLSPEEQKKHRRDQAVSWVFGEMGLAGRDFTKDQAEAAVDLHDFEKCVVAVKDAFAQLPPDMQRAYLAKQAQRYDDGGLNLP